MQCSCVTVPRSVCTAQGSTFELHGFADASKHAVCAAIYAIEHDGDTGEIISRHLLVAKSRVAPAGMTIPRLELIAAHTLVKLQRSASSALESVPITAIHHWGDSTTVLHWLKDTGTWSVFVRNRAKKIRELSQGEWRYVPTTDNPSDLGTRGIKPNQLGPLWFKGPEWLEDRESWPGQPETMETPETNTEKVRTKKKTMMTIEGNGFVETMSSRFDYWRMIRVTSWILRFKNNCTGRNR